ncbi:MAG: response regulator transcription factor [Eubacteriales bacterium]|nr:response regulator transcription factor [Eubacteriales bacterium]
MGRPQIIIVEDEESIAELLEFNLQNEGYACNSFTSGEDMFRFLEEKDHPSINLFILDLMLPDMDGLDICEHLRASSQYQNSLIMMLTARGTEQDKVRGLETGADDYMTKPFGIREFLARVRALLRRYVRMSQQSAEEAAEISDSAPYTLPTPNNASGPEDDLRKQLRAGDVVLDDAKHVVNKAGQELEMTHREYELLKFLMLHRGIAYSRDDLLNYVWGYDYSGETRTVDVHIRQLRRKIEDDSSHPELIQTVRGFGYRFKEDD